MPEGGKAAALGPQMIARLGGDVDPPAPGAGNEAQIGGGEGGQGGAQRCRSQARGTDSGNSPASPASLAGQRPRSVMSPVT